MSSDTKLADAHTAAVDAFTRATKAQIAAEAELSTAKLAKETLLGRAADGEPVGTADIHAVEKAIHEAEACVSLACAVVDGKRRLMEKAEIAVLTERAAELTAAWLVAVQRRIEAAQAADDALEGVTIKLKELDNAHLALSLVYADAYEHDRHVAERAVDNAELARIEIPYRPRAANRMALHEHQSLEVSYVARSWGGRAPRDTRLGPQARALYGSQVQVMTKAS